MDRDLNKLESDCTPYRVLSDTTDKAVPYVIYLLLTESLLPDAVASRYTKNF